VAAAGRRDQRNWYEPGRFWSGEGLQLSGGYELGGEIAVQTPTLPDPPLGTIAVLGIDDFATRRGHRYGTDGDKPKIIAAEIHSPTARAKRSGATGDP
jgi:hypothetical protein